MTKNMHRIMVSLFIFLSFALVKSSFATGKEPEKSTKPTLNAAAIDRELGKAGETKDGVHRFSFPRTDLRVQVEGVAIRAGLALGSWMAFKPVGEASVVHGDLVLTEAEVYPVLRELHRHDLKVTAIHNHLIHESPRVMYLHFWGKGNAAYLANGLKHALSQTKTPLSDSKGEGVTEEAGFNTVQIQKTLDQTGTLNGGVLKISVSRPEKITMDAVELPPSMGMATSLNFQAAGEKKVAATGDFVMTGEEVNRVARALVEHGIEVTALHNHLIDDSPDLFFMHFWAHDSSEKVAQGLKAALDAMKKK